MQSMVMPSSKRCFEVNFEDHVATIIGLSSAFARSASKIPERIRTFGLPGCAIHVFVSKAVKRGSDEVGQRFRVEEIPSGYGVWFWSTR